jgi:hypothetical protein
VEFNRTFRESWAIPQMCCICGEPAVDGKAHVASATLGRTMTKAGVMNSVDVMNTTSISIPFPTCAACDRARKVKSRYDNITGAVGLLVGFTGCVYAANANGGWLPWLIFVAVWFAIAWAIQTLADRRMAARLDADALRRAKLSPLPVEIKKVTKSASVPVLKFKFANDEYGTAFSDSNP